MLDKEDAAQLSISLDAWIDRYTSDHDAGVVELANFFISASGLSPAPLDLANVEDDVEVHIGSAHLAPAHAP